MASKDSSDAHAFDGLLALVGSTTEADIFTGKAAEQAADIEETEDSDGDRSSVGTLRAEPIAPPTHARFPHLKSFEGHILLGNGKVQIVIAGVPAQASTLFWQSGILAFFEFKEGAWHRLEAVAALDLQRVDSEGKPFYAVGLDLSVDQKAQQALVTLIYATSESKLQKTAVSFRIDGRTSVVTLVTDVSDTKIKNVDNNFWRLRLRSSETGRTLPGPKDTGTERFVLRYHQADVVALVGTQVFSWQEKPAELFIQPLTATSFDLLIGQNIASQLPRRLAAVSEEKTGIATFTSAASDPGGAKNSQPVLLFNAAAEPVAYFTVPVGGHRSVLLPADQAYIVANTVNGRVWKSIPEIKLAVAERRLIELPPRRAGELRLKSRNRSAAMILVRDADERTAAGQILKVDTNTREIGGGLYAVAKWPITVNVLAGTYDISWLSEFGTMECRQKVNVKPERTVISDCMPAKIGKEVKKKVPEFLSKAKSKIILIEREDQKLGFANKALNSLWTRSSMLETIAVTDQQNGLTLTLLGVDEAMADSWQLIAARPLKRHESMTGRFIEFARQLKRLESPSPPPLLELGCPSAGLDLPEYVAIAADLNPDAVQLFGCTAFGAGDGLATLLAEIQARAAQPLILTATAGWGRVPQGLAPNYLILQDVDVLDPLAALHAARVTISAGSVLSKVGLKATNSQPQKPKTNAAASGTMTLRISAVIQAPALTRVLQVVLYNELGWTEELGFTENQVFQDPSGAVAIDLDALVNVPANSEWLRIEVKGFTPWAGDATVRMTEEAARKASSILAATGFLKIVNLLAQ